MVKKTTFKGGLDLKILEDHEFEVLTHVSPEQDALSTARNALRFLMMGWSSSWTDFISWSVFKAVFIQRDPQLTKALRLAFQQGFNNLFKQLSALQLNEEQEEQVQLYLSNCLSLLPYSDLTPYESIKIPQLINKQWELVEYYVTPIELTSLKDIVKDQDRVFAYGLQPITHPSAKSHLIFMGTTYPAGQGFIPQIDTDFKAFDMVGNTLYKSGRARLLQWLSQQKTKVHVCGVSLGGALSLLFVLDQGEYVDRVDALNTPGLADAKNKLDRWDSLTNKPQVVVQKQADDPVSMFGLWKKEWEIVQVTPPDNKRGPNAFCDHFLNYAGFAETQFSYVSAEEENLNRKYRNFLLFSLGRGLVYYGAIWPYSFLLRPSAYYLYEHLYKKAFLFSLGVALSTLLVLTCFSVAPLLILASSLVAGLVSYCIALPWFSSTMKGNALKEERFKTAKLHDPKLPRNTELDIYNPENSLDIELTHGQLNTYYSVMRCLVKEKELIPAEEKPYKHNNEVSKKELLMACQELENKDQKIKVHMPKAKIINVKRVLDLVEKIGMENREELKEAVEGEYRQYCLGK